LRAAIDAVKMKFASIREAIEKRWPDRSTPPCRRTKIVADNAVFNAGVTTLLDEQVRRLAGLDGNAYGRAATPTPPGHCATSWPQRQPHKSLVGSKRVATEAEKTELMRSTGKTEQILSALQDCAAIRRRPQRDRSLGKMQADYVEPLWQRAEARKEGAVSGKYDRMSTLIRGNRRSASRDHHGTRRLL